jgi:hypothetical protein
MYVDINFQCKNNMHNWIEELKILNKEQQKDNELCGCLQN